MNCEIADCINNARFHLTRIESRSSLFEKYMCDSHMRAYVAEFFRKVTVGVGSTANPAGFVTADFDLLIWDNTPDREDLPAYVNLREVGGLRHCGAKIDGWAWSAMMAQLRHRSAPRPVTHVGWAETIRALGGRLQDVVVEKFDSADNWYDTKLRIRQHDRLLNVDVRASDGYVLAVVFDVPIFVAEKLMVRARQSHLIFRRN